MKYDYWTVQKMAAEEIRKIDPETPIYVESNLWSAPATFSYFSPIKLKNIIYQFHMYQPGQFTHQLVGGNFGEKGADELIRYPGVIGRKILEQGGTAENAGARSGIPAETPGQNLLRRIFRHHLGAGCGPVSPRLHQPLRRVWLGLDLSRLP